MSFTATCQGIAERFIQTVVVIDDQGFPAAPESPQTFEAIEPDVPGYAPSLSGPEPPSNDRGIERRETEDPDPVKHSLDGMGLTRRFAALGINCAIYVPADDEGLPDSNTTSGDMVSDRLARRADVVVVDWLLDGKSSNQARGFIKRILEDDRRQGGRLRLITVYTGADGLEKHRDDLRADLGNAGIEMTEDNLDGVLALAAPQLRIVFLHKEHESLPLSDHSVSEHNLPTRLVQEFSQLSIGIMPVVALAAVSAVRDDTHKLLSKFGRFLDPALAAHRSMLSSPLEAENYAEKLIAEEMLVCINDKLKDRLHACEALFEQWIDHLVKQGHKFNLNNKPANELTPERVKKLLSHGADEHEAVGKGHSGSNVAKEKVWRSLTNLFAASPTEADTANLAFARIALLEREAYGAMDAAESFSSQLTLGSILGCSKLSLSEGQPAGTEYYVCVQPRCDAVRLPAARSFPLLPLDVGSDTSKFSLVVRSREKVDIKLHPRMKPFEVKMVDFAPTRSVGEVRPEHDGGKQCFRSVDGTLYEWLADMRPSPAQRLVQQLSSQFGRVGLDEYEWLRRSSG